MKPDTIHVSSASTTPLVPLITFATAKIVRHPRSKKTKEPELMPPDEETLLRLNAMAKQYPFCILHREKNTPLL
jgi:hypothetical protein